ncbi:MAG: D-2-hydroxyacid dehydrogenase [Ilumatobacteraceae bacterium]|nr:D-2-hydroxyacid dehydrogenase [Ilumatobacteraceae bacterium]
MATLFCSDTFWDDHGDDIVAIDPTIDVVRLVGSEHVAPADLERITIAFFSGDTWPERSGSFLGACTRAPHLEWLQSFSAGTDHPVFGAIRDRGVTVTCSAGSSAPSIAQTVMLYLLALSRDLPRLNRAQSERRWSPGPSRDLHGLRLGIVGLGGIGTEVERLARAFEMDVVGLRRTVRGDEPCETWPNEQLAELLGWADAIVVAAPLNAQTAGMFDADAFATMRRGAWFVNVGRGEIVDEVALADALSSGHLGGAGLDVFATEPLPSTSPLWDLPNVIITPHSSGNTDRSRQRSIRQFIENFRRHTDGEPLHNVTGAAD